MVEHSTPNPRIEGSNPATNTGGLYYKHVTIVNDDSSVISKWSFKLIDDPRVIINDHNMFIIQAMEEIKW